MQLITSPQTLTGSWVDLGAEVEVNQHNRIGIWLNVDINDSQNVRLRALAKLGQNAANEYNLLIKNVSASSVAVESEFFEFNVDADQLAVLEVVTNGLVPFVQFQVQAGTVGASAGQIDEADYTLSNTQ